MCNLKLKALCWLHQQSSALIELTSLWELCLSCTVSHSTYGRNVAYSLHRWLFMQSYKAVTYRAGLQAGGVSHSVTILEALLLNQIADIHNAAVSSKQWDHSYDQSLHGCTSLESEPYACCHQHILTILQCHALRPGWEPPTCHCTSQAILYDMHSNFSCSLT